MPPGAEAYLRDLPEAKLVWLDAGHFVLDENVHTVADEIKAVFGPRPSPSHSEAHLRVVSCVMVQYTIAQLISHIRVRRGCMQRFNGKRVLVTGSGRGIGAAIARRFALEGARVYLTARSHEELSSTRDELRSLTSEVEFASLDLTQPDAAASSPPMSSNCGAVSTFSSPMQALRPKVAFSN